MNMTSKSVHGKDGQASGDEARRRADLAWWRNRIAVGMVVATWLLIRVSRLVGL